MFNTDGNVPCWGKHALDKRACYLFKEPTKFPTGSYNLIGSDIIPPPCCFLSHSLPPTERSQKVCLARRPNHHTFPKSLCWLAADALHRSQFAPSSRKETETLQWRPQSPGRRHYSPLWTGQLVAAAAGTIHHNTHPNYLMCHSKEWWWQNTADCSTLVALVLVNGPFRKELESPAWLHCFVGGSPGVTFTTISKPRSNRCLRCKSIGRKSTFFRLMPTKKINKIKITLNPLFHHWYFPRVSHWLRKSCSQLICILNLILTIAPVLDQATQDSNKSFTPACWTLQYSTRKPAQLQHLFTDTWGSCHGKKIPSDGWASSEGGRDDEVQSEAFSRAVINGVLPETSAAPLSIIVRVAQPSGGMTVSVVRSLAVGGRLLRVSSAHVCQYKIEMIAGRVGALWQWRHSQQTVIHQWFPPAAGRWVVGLLRRVSSGSGALLKAEVFELCFQIFSRDIITVNKHVKKIGVLLWLILLKPMRVASLLGFCLNSSCT